MDETQTTNSKISKTETSNVSQELFDQLLNPTLDLSIDYSEIYLDDLIDNEAIKEIPIIKTVVGVIKGGISINQFWFAKKLLTFIRDFNQNSLNTKQINQFKTKLDSEPKFRKKVAEKLMIFIDRNIEITQTRIIANLFSAYVKGQMDFYQFNNVIITLDKLNPKSFESFFELEKIDFSISEQNHKQVGKRNFEMEAFITNSGFALETSSWFHGFELTEDGKVLFELGIKPITKK